MNLRNAQRAISATTSSTRITGSHTMPNQIAPETIAWPAPIRVAVAPSTSDVDLHDLRAEGGHERPVGDLILQLQPLAVQLFDLAADVGDPRLDLQEVGDLAGSLGDVHEHLLAGPQVPEPGFDVDQLPAHLGRLGLLAHDLGREAAQRRQGILPAGGRDTVGDGGDGAVAVVGFLGCADVPAGGEYGGLGLGEGGPQVVHDKLQGAGVDDLEVIARRGRRLAGAPHGWLADDVLGWSFGGGRLGRGGLGGGTVLVADGAADGREDR
jgi:hypothetical protein